MYTFFSQKCKDEFSQQIKSKGGFAFLCGFWSLIGYAVMHDIRESRAVDTDLVRHAHKVEGEFRRNILEENKRMREGE